MSVQLLTCLLTTSPFLGIAAALLLGLPSGSAFGAAFGGVLGIVFGGVLGAAAPRAFFTAARITAATSSSVASAAALFLVNCALSPKAAGTRVADGFEVAGTADAAITALLMRHTPAPCLPPQST